MFLCDSVVVWIRIGPCRCKMCRRLSQLKQDVAGVLAERSMLGVEGKVKCETRRKKDDIVLIRQRCTLVPKRRKSSPTLVLVGNAMHKARMTGIYYFTVRFFSSIYCYLAFLLLWSPSIKL